MEGMAKISKKPIKITDTTLRDGHQSTLATRMRTEDMVPIAADLDQIGFHSVEVWGGATFDVAHRFLGEDPWERVRVLKRLMPKTPFQMLLRGQNLVAYRNHPDDLVQAFIEKSAEVGIEIFRCFDAVNDERNFETAFKTIKKMGKHIQGTICYSLTERRMGGPIFNLNYYLEKAKILEGMGSDSLCIKDMAGLLAPYDAYELVKGLRKTVNIPIQLHTHYTSGMGSMTYLKAIEAGVDIIDTALAPFALRSSQPAVEPIIVALEGTPWDTGLDLTKLLKLGEHIEAIAPKYRDFLDTTRMAVIDTGVLRHQIPGGMISNMVSQLKQQKALNRIEEVYAELPQTRKDLGYPPLVTPTSQIVGVQAVLNVLFGRYKMVSMETQDYAYGLYGRPPVPISDEVKKLVLKGFKRGKEPITCRPADLIEPELDKANEETKGLAKDLCDTLIYALYPKTGIEFLKWKYGREPMPEKLKPKTLEDVRKEDEAIAKAKSEALKKTA
jgi:pyruvate/oxaloacetate carboxyltransferase